MENLKLLLIPEDIKCQAKTWRFFFPVSGGVLEPVSDVQKDHQSIFQV